MNVINGRTYPLWQQFVDRKDEWIGGTLTDPPGEDPTLITDVELKANGTDSAMFSFLGTDYDCGFDVGFGGVTGDHVENGLMFIRSFGGKFSATKKPEAQ